MKRRHLAGQAMVEFVVTLVAVLVLITAILQIGQLGLLHSKTLHDARDRAGALSLLPNPTLAGPDYISDWTPGRMARSRAGTTDPALDCPADSRPVWSSPPILRFSRISFLAIPCPPSREILFPS